jgi:ABC-type bacteriocin/lantibiotic exporter with double-glycine peptidase domain
MVHLEHLSFQFQHEKSPILHDINLDVAAGERILVCGKNGSGKTTMLRLIAGLYTSFNGAITYNGIPLRNLQPDSLRSRIGDHFHASEVFRGTFLENIQAGRDELSLADIQKAIEMVELSEFIQSMPDGYNTMLDPEGKQFPSGIVRKLILARAIVGFPSMLLIEDNLMSLPTRDREIIFNRILDPAINWTVIIISSDYHMAKKVSRVVVLENGTISEIAPYSSLINKKYLSTSNLD